MIDGYPVPPAAAGKPRLCGLSEAACEEGHRLATTVALLHANGVPVRVEDDMIVTGNHAGDIGSERVRVPMHHRPAIGGVVTGLAVRRSMKADGPGFVSLMNRQGAGPVEPRA